MILPPYLIPGDAIGIVAPARKISPSDIETAINHIASFGFMPICGENLYTDNHQFAGSDAERTSDFQKMLDHPEIKALLFARGGYGSARIVDQINFSNLPQNPKWLVGFSDITVFHSLLQSQWNMSSLHAAMPVNFNSLSPDHPSITSLFDALSGKKIQHSFPKNPLNREENFQGFPVGGNLSVLYSMMGGPGEINTTDKILFIEDLDEYLYHIDRMMINLKRAGKLQHLSGLIVGGMTDMHDNAVSFGHTAEEIILDAVKEFDYPVCFNFPAGHINPNLAFKLGAHCKVEFHQNEVIFTQIP